MKKRADVIKKYAAIRRTMLESYQSDAGKGRCSEGKNEK